QVACRSGLLSLLHVHQRPIWEIDVARFNPSPVEVSSNQLPIQADTVESTGQLLVVDLLIIVWIPSRKDQVAYRFTEDIVSLPLDVLRVVVVDLVPRSVVERIRAIIQAGFEG